MKLVAVMLSLAAGAAVGLQVAATERSTEAQSIVRGVQGVVQPVAAFQRTPGTRPAPGQRPEGKPPDGVRPPAGGKPPDGVRPPGGGRRGDGPPPEGGRVRPGEGQQPPAGGRRGGRGRRGGGGTANV